MKPPRFQPELMRPRNADAAAANSTATSVDLLTNDLAVLVAAAEILP